MSPVECLCQKKQAIHVHMEVWMSGYSSKERENAQKCDDPASLEKEKKNNQKKTKFKNLKLQLGYLAIFSNHIIYFDISEALQF